MMKVPTYIAQEQMNVAQPNLLSGSDIATLSSTRKADAATNLGGAISNLGQDVFKGEMIKDEALKREQERVSAEIKQRKKEQDTLSVAKNAADQLEFWTKNLDESWDDSTPDGFTERFMTSFRDTTKEQYSSYAEKDSDFANIWAGKMVQLQTHLFALANSKEAAGRIYKQEGEVQSTMLTTANNVYSNPPPIEMFVYQMDNFTDGINAQAWGATNHGKQLASKGKDEIATSYVRGLLNKEMTSTAKKLLDDGLLDKYLLPGNKVTLGQMIAGAEKHDNTVNKYRFTETATSNISAVANGLAPTTIDKKAYVKDMGEGSWEKYQDDLKFAGESFKIKTEIERLSLIDAQAYVNDLRPTENVAGVNFADKEKLYAAAQQLLQQHTAEVEKDAMMISMQEVEKLRGKQDSMPYLYSMIGQNDEGKGDVAFEMQYATGEVYKGKWPDYVKQAIALADSKGYPRNGMVTPKDMVKRDVAMVTALPPEQLVPFISGKKELWGDMFDNYWRDLCAVGKLPTEYKMVAFAAGTEFQNKIVNAIRIPEEKLRKAFPTDTEYKDARNLVLGKLEPFKRAINVGAASGRVMANGEIFDMADVLTKTVALDFITGANTKSKSDIASNLVNDFINSKFHFVDKYLIPIELENRSLKGTPIAPTKVSKSIMSDIRNKLDYLKSEDGMTSKAFMPKSASNEFDSARLKRAYAGGAYWVSNEDFTGVYLQYDYALNNDVRQQAVTNAAGKRYEFKFKDLISLEVPTSVTRENKSPYSFQGASKQNKPRF